MERRSIVHAAAVSLVLAGCSQDGGSDTDGAAASSTRGESGVVSSADGSGPVTDGPAPSSTSAATTVSTSAANTGQDTESSGDTSGEQGPFSCAERWPDHPEWLLCDDFELGGGDFEAWRETTPFHAISGDERGRTDLSNEHTHGGDWAMHFPALESSNFAGGSLEWMSCADGEYSSGCSLAGYETIYTRLWVRFASDHELVHHFLRLGGRYTQDSPYDASLPGGNFNGTAGCLPDGTTHMDMTVEVSRSSDPLRNKTGYFYSYHRNMEPSCCGGGTDGNGNCVNNRFDQICADCSRWDAISLEPSCGNSDERCYWGDTFEVSDAELDADPDRYTFPKGEWFCVEAAFTANTPGLADGKMEYWINDGPGYAVEAMDWRTVDTVKVNRVSVQHYVSGEAWFGTPVQSNKAWYDDVVISTERIGCN